MEREREFGGQGKDFIDIHKSIDVDAPVDQAFREFSNWENFPRFMSNVKEVRETGRDRLHWKASGPLGTTTEWDAVVTEFVPNQVIAWRSEPGSQIEQAGNLYFRQNPDSSTRVDVRLSYRPPGGGLGHAVASLFGANPDQQMDEDLKRMKEYIESQYSAGGYHGRTPYSGAGGFPEAGGSPPRGTTPPGGTYPEGQSRPTDEEY